MEREFLTAGTAAKMFEPKGQITSRTGLAEVPLKVNKGTAEEQQLPLRVF